MIQQIINTLVATNLPIETQDERAIKFRGVFNNQSIIIVADHYQRQVLFVSTSLRQQKTYSYDQFFYKFCLN